MKKYMYGYSIVGVFGGLFTDYLNSLLIIYTVK